MSVIVFGSLVMDVVAFCDRHPVPGETVIGSRIGYYPGGKGANQALAAAKAGADAKLYGAVGKDSFGQILVDFLFDNGVDTQPVAMHADASTGVGMIGVSASGENAIIFVAGANDLAAVPADAIQEPIIGLGQFEISREETRQFFRQVRSKNGVTILNPSPYRDMDDELIRLSSYLIVNELEFAALTKEPVTQDVTEIKERLSVLPFMFNDIIVTLGDAGFVLKDKGQYYDAPGHKVTAVDTTGAGDCFAGSFAAELAKGAKPFEAALYANAAAALSVTKAGAGPSMPTRVEVETMLRQGYQKRA